MTASQSTQSADDSSALFSHRASEEPIDYQTFARPSDAQPLPDMPFLAPPATTEDDPDARYPSRRPH